MNDKRVIKFLYFRPYLFESDDKKVVLFVIWFLIMKWNMEL